MDFLKPIQKDKSELNALQKQNSDLQETQAILKAHCTHLYEALGAMKPKNLAGDWERKHRELKETHSLLQAHCNSLHDAMETLKSRHAKETEKMRLESLFHKEQAETLERGHRTLQERCQSLSAMAELHRMANLQHQAKAKEQEGKYNTLKESHNRLINEMDSLASSKDSHLLAVHRLQEENKRLEEKCKMASTKMGEKQRTLDKNMEVLREQQRSEMDEMKREHIRKVKSLEEKLAANSKKLELSTQLIKAAPINKDLNVKACSVVKSSAEILEMAHDRGGVETTKKCLSQVASVLRELHTELNRQGSVGSAWLDKAT